MYVRKWQNKMNRFSLRKVLFCENKEGMITDLANLTLDFLRGFQKVVTNRANWDCGMNCLQKPRKISLQLGTLSPCINIKANIDPRSVMEMFLLWMVLSGSLGRALLSRWELSCYPKWQLADAHIPFANLYWSPKFWRGWDQLRRLSPRGGQKSMARTQLGGNVYLLKMYLHIGIAIKHLSLVTSFYQDMGDDPIVAFKLGKRAWQRLGSFMVIYGWFS